MNFNILSSDDIFYNVGRETDSADSPPQKRKSTNEWKPGMKVFIPLTKKRNGGTAPRPTESPAHTPRTVSATTKAKAINGHPYSLQRPEFAQLLIDDGKVSLNEAIDALNELAGIEDKPSMTRFEKLNQRLDGKPQQDDSKAQASVTPIRNTGTMTRFQRQQAKLDRLYGDDDGGAAA